MAVPLISPSPWRDVRVADREQGAVDLHGIVHHRAGADAPVVDIAAVRGRAGWC